MANFQSLFSTPFLRLNKYLDTNPVYNFYIASCPFDPRQLLWISYDNDSFAAIKDFQDPNDSFEKFQIYVNYQDNLENPFNIPAFCNEDMRFSLLEVIANKFI